MSVEIAEHPQPPVSMIERMTLVLEAFPDWPTRLGLEDVARATQLPRSTAHRILDQLVRLNWLERSHAGYGLGRRALHLGGAADEITALRSAAAPLLHSLMLRTGLTVHLAILDEGSVLYLDKLGSHCATAVPSRVGGRAPAHCTALGKAMLAWLPPEEVDQRVGRAAPEKAGWTARDLDRLHVDLNRIRVRQGLAIERGECFEELSCVSAAIRAAAAPIAAISVTGDTSRRPERAAPLVLSAARQISVDLSSGPGAD